MARISLLFALFGIYKFECSLMKRIFRYKKNTEYGNDINFNFQNPFVEITMTEQRTKFILTALAEIGVAEIPGLEVNPQILKYFHETGFEYIKDETISWCAAFVNWCCKKNSLELAGDLMARTRLKIGKRVLQPRIGDIVVLWRESKNSYKGHVGIFINQIKDNIYVLGGNQDNMVNIKSYPLFRLLGVRDIFNVPNMV